MSLTRQRDEPNYYATQIRESTSPFQYVSNQAVLRPGQSCHDMTKYGRDIGKAENRNPLLRSGKVIDIESELTYRTHPLGRDPNTQFPNLSHPSTVGDTFHRPLPVAAACGTVDCKNAKQAKHTRIDGPLIKREEIYPSTQVPLCFNPQDERVTGRFDSFLTQLYEKDNYRLRLRKPVEATNEVSALSSQVAQEAAQVSKVMSSVPPPPSIPSMLHTSRPGRPGMVKSAVEPFAFGGSCGCGM
jgi:hypothetical protein